MSFANVNVSDIIATTIESRTKSIADNVTKNNALLSRLEQRGKIKTVSGGSKIFEELSFAENGNAGWYSGYDLLPVAAQDVISAAEYEFKQAACPVTISGLDMLKNSGKEAMIDLLEGRISVAEATMANLIAGGVYSDGTGAGGKQLTGLNAAVPVTPAGTTYGGIVTNNFPFWTNAVQDQTAAQLTAALVQGYFNNLWAKLVRGSDRPDLIVIDAGVWAIYLASLQTNQRFTDSGSATLGFPTLKYMDADVVLDGGIGGFCPLNTGFFLNTKYLKYRPHSSRNMVPLAPNKRYAINQDAEVQILAWAGNLTCSGRQFQGRLDFNG
jgi:hypothetical protein